MVVGIEGGTKMSRSSAQTSRSRTSRRIGFGPRSFLRGWSSWDEYTPFRRRMPLYGVQLFEEKYFLAFDTWAWAKTRTRDQIPYKLRNMREWIFQDGLQSPQKRAEAWPKAVSDLLLLSLSKTLSRARSGVPASMNATLHLSKCLVFNNIKRLLEGALRRENEAW